MSDSLFSKPDTPKRITMATQDLLLMVLLLSPGLLLSVTIMLTFAAGG